MIHLFLMLFTLLSCGGGSDLGCASDDACEFGQLCIEGECRTSACNTSAQCPMESYCGPDRTCLSGCASSDDCFFGSTCDGGTCVDKACTDTDTDCGFREFCNVAEGECYDAGDLYCRPCGDDSECGDGNICWAGHCGVDCTNNDCPSGFDCYAIGDSAGNTTGYQCLTYCWLFEDYAPGSFLKGEGVSVAPPLLDPTTGRTATPKACQ